MNSLMETNETLIVDNLSITLRKTGQKVVDNVSFKIAKGETVALLGESGAGKTTLFRAVMGLLESEVWLIEGSIKMGGHEVVGLSPRKWEGIRGNYMRCIFQEPALSLNPSIKVDHQLIEAVRVVDPQVKKEDAVYRIKKAIKHAGLKPEMVIGRYPRELSGGQRQRVGIALSLVCPSPLLLADEPSNSLDSVTITELIATIRKLQAEKVIETIFIITHDLNVLQALECKRVIFMDEGKLSEVGSIDNVLENPGHPKLAEIVSLKSLVNIREEEEVQKQSTPLVEVKNLSYGYLQKSFFQKTRDLVVQDVNLSIDQGEFIALVGNSGSGKSTIASNITREFTGFDGDILFDTKPLKNIKTHKEAGWFHRSVQVIFQEPADTFDPSLSIRENLEECFFAMDMTREDIEAALDDLLGRLNLEVGMLDKLPKNLSGGQKQRFALLRAFGPKPKMMVADEPFNNLDLIAQQRLIELLKERKDDPVNPMSCLLISHDIGVVSKLCDQVYVVFDGKIAESGNVESILFSPASEASKRLVQAAQMLGTYS